MSSALQAAKRIREEAKESGAEKLRPGNKKGLPLSSKPEFMVLMKNARAVVIVPVASVSLSIIEKGGRK